MIWLEIPLPRSFLVRVSYTSIDLSYYFLTRHDSTGNKDKSGKAMKKLIKIFLWFDQKSLFHQVSSWGCLLFSYTAWLYRVCLDWTYCCWKLKTDTLFTHCAYTVHVLKNIKNEFRDTIYTFKNYFATVFSVFSFQQQ